MQTRLTKKLLGKREVKDRTCTAFIITSSNYSKNPYNYAMHIVCKLKNEQVTSKSIILDKPSK